MSKLFKSLESAPRGKRLDTGALLDAVRWNVAGLIPAIAQQHDSGATSTGSGPQRRQRPRVSKAFQRNTTTDPSTSTASYYANGNRT